MFRCNHTAVVSSRMVSLSRSRTHTQTHPSFLHKELHIFLPKISLKTHFCPHIYIFFFFCVCKFIVCALFVSVCFSEKPFPTCPPFAVKVAVCWKMLPRGVDCCLSQTVAPAMCEMWGSCSAGLALALPCSGSCSGG